MEHPEIPLNALKPGSANNLRGRKCHVCSLPLKIRSAIDERMARGDKVAEIYPWAKRTFKDDADLQRISLDAFYKHRKIHVLKLQRAAAKLSDAQRMVFKQNKLAKAVLEDKVVDPIVYFGPQAIAEDLKKTSDRLHTAADDALLEKQHSSLASLSSALIRSAEVRGKMGGVIAEKTELNVNLSISDLHARLDGILGNSADDRASAARALLGLAPPLAGASPTFVPDDAPDDSAIIDAEINPQSKSGS